MFKALTGMTDAQLQEIIAPTGHYATAVAACVAGLNGSNSVNGTLDWREVFAKAAESKQVTGKAGKTPREVVLQGLKTAAPAPDADITVTFHKHAKDENLIVAQVSRKTPVTQTPEIPTAEDSKESK
jgi:hypothetical protein